MLNDTSENFGNVGGDNEDEDEEEDEEDEDEDGVRVPDEPIPALFLPGRILHLYSYMGVYRAATVSREFPSLRFAFFLFEVPDKHLTVGLLT